MQRPKEIMKFLRACPMSVALSMTFIAYSVNGALIQGPLPMKVLAPIGEIAELNCTVNISELKEQKGGMFSSITWITQNQALLTDINPTVTGGKIKTSTIRVPLTEEFTAGVSIRCVAVTFSSLSETPSSTSANLTAYGMYRYTETGLVQV